ncbi:hypothetical protein BDP81DRAFT_430596 [Colletotrichum phormii]|uniref:Secreted protein n=1 Tax=Colletotrichum phormii TaxID=359342 RepID=A0AAI9ZMY7_9PEZI|nr:uncharacterized protein BDP81DRAFT_430596 [Colletotrichum phormii]KAK1634977.1 hypothetical protein BDP81DRAFT_430596 [Colletotrichum phormii]
MLAAPSRRLKVFLVFWIQSRTCSGLLTSTTVASTRIPGLEVFSSSATALRASVWTSDIANDAPLLAR